MGVPTGKLKGELESLKDFKNRVDDILEDLGSSPASPTKVGQQEVKRSSFGGEFAEADGVYSQYARVHAQLTRLSGVLGDQIEAMRIAVHGADVGFGNLEDDLKRRFWALQTRAHQHQQHAASRQPPEDEATGVTY